MSTQDTSHAWIALRCTVCGVQFVGGEAYYPCVGSPPYVKMADENDVRQADRAEETAVTKRVTDVISDLTAGKVGRTQRGELGDALQRANRDGNVGRAISRSRSLEISKP